MEKKLLVLSAPSGGGKTTVARKIRKLYPQFEFSVSATTRNMRPKEMHARDYYFYTRREFEDKIADGGFIEHEEIFGNYYGTLKSEIDSKIGAGKYLIFDVDVKGALSLKKAYPEESVLIFLMPPDKATLQQRLKNRQTEQKSEIETRLARAEMEISQKDSFDHIIMNVILDDTFRKVEEIVKENFILFGRNA
jgi:guanylate kinase